MRTTTSPATRSPAGADEAFFSIGATSGALTFDAAPNYEDAKDQGSNNTYVVVGDGDQRHGHAG